MKLNSKLLDISEEYIDFTNETKGFHDIKGNYDDWEIVLLVDIREKDYALIQTRMIERDINCEARNLSVGDYLWIARKKPGVVM